MWDTDNYYNVIFGSDLSFLYKPVEKAKARDETQWVTSLVDIYHEGQPPITFHDLTGQLTNPESLEVAVRLVSMCTGS